MAQKTKINPVRKKNRNLNSNASSIKRGRLKYSSQLPKTRFSNRVKFPKKIVDHYIENLKQKVKVKGVLLFGSFAWGKPTKHSDVDLVIISPDFKKIKDPLQWLSRMRDDVTYQIAMDIIGYTPKEFAHIEKHSAIMAKAKKQGKWIHQVKSP